MLNFYSDKILGTHFNQWLLSLNFLIQYIALIEIDSLFSTGLINFILFNDCRLLLISGDIDTCINELLDIIPLLEENQKFNNNESGSTELRLLVHQSQAGCIIGRGGDKIKDLRIVSITIFLQKNKMNLNMT